MMMRNLTFSNKAAAISLCLFRRCFKLPSVQRSERYNSRCLNHYLLDVFSHGLLIAQRHVFFPFFLFVQTMIDSLVCFLHQEFMFIDVNISANT